MVFPDKSPSAEGLMVVYDSQLGSESTDHVRVRRDWLWG